MCVCVGEGVSLNSHSKGPCEWGSPCRVDRIDYDSQCCKIRLNSFFEYPQEGAVDVIEFEHGIRLFRSLFSFSVRHARNITIRSPTPTPSPWPSTLVRISQRILRKHNLCMSLYMHALLYPIAKVRFPPTNAFLPSPVVRRGNEKSKTPESLYLRSQKRLGAMG